MGFDGVKVEDLNQLQRLMSRKEPADHVRLKIYRRGVGFKDVGVALDEMPKSDELPVEKDLF